MLNFRKHMNNEHPCLVEKLEEMERKIESGGGVKVNTVTLHKNDFTDITINTSSGSDIAHMASFGYTDTGEKIDNAYNHIFRLVENTYNHDKTQLIAQTPCLLTCLTELFEDVRLYYASIAVDSNAINVYINDAFWSFLKSDSEMVLSFI